MRTKFRKLTSILLAVIMAFSIFTIVPITASAETSGDFDYKVLDDGTAEITKYKNDDATEVTIPSELDGYTVTSIGMNAFMSKANLTSVVFSNSLTNIGNFAFPMCTGLTEITIPDGVTRIGLCAFNRCTSLASVTIPDSVTSIGGSAFLDTKIYENHPNGVFYVDGWACSYKGTMPANTTIELKDGTRGLADRALYYNANLVSVTIPDSVKYIGEGEFNKCTGLTSATIGNGVTSIRKETFSECTSLTDLTIGNGVTSIGASAFYNCNSLKNVTIPDSVTEIGDKAFSLCKSLESMVIPKSVTHIEKTAFNYHSDTLTIYGFEGSEAETFANDNGITFISIGSNVLTCGDFEYSILEDGTAEIIGYNGNAEALTIPSKLDVYTVTSIYGGFENCTSLTSVTIPGSVTDVGGWVFRDCTNLASVTIGNGVESIGTGAFYGCESLTSITIPDSVTLIGLFSLGHGVDGFTIYGYAGSEAETYANENGFTFINLGDEPKPLLGDVDRDKELTVKDATEIQKYIVEIAKFDDEQLKLADVDGDKDITVKDATTIQKIIVELV